MRTLFLAIALLAAGPNLAAAKAKPEHRCGWIANPTPANWWLTDRDGDWTISMQGGYQAGGADLPDFSTHDWVVTNAGDHGFGCACLSATFDHKQKRVIRIVAARQRPLRVCKADRSLKAPE